MNKVLGIDIGGTKVAFGVVSNNKIETRNSIVISSNKPQHEIINEIFSAIDVYMGNQIEGIGIGAPGFIDSENGILYQLNNIPSWKEVHLKQAFEERYKVPVYVNNDANCFAIGEKYFGKGQQYKNFVGLTVGTGLGTGIIANNHLYSGVNCGAGEFGCVPYLNNIVEYYCSGQYFIREHGISGSELSFLANKNNYKVQEIFNAYGTHLGNAIKIILYALAPQAIIIGGSVSKSFNLFQEAMWQSVREFPFSKVIENLVIEKSELADSPILGAAALYLDSLK